MSRISVDTEAKPSTEGKSYTKLTLTEVLNQDQGQLERLEETVDSLRALRDGKKLPTEETRFITSILDQEKLPPYQSVSFVPEIGEKFAGEPKIGFFLLPGAIGTAEANIAEPREFIEQTKDLFPVGVAASLSSSVSLDTTEHPFSSDVAVRASEQALLILELAKRQGVTELYLVGHSLGGMEATYVVSALKLLDPTLKIGGLILSQAAGQYPFKGSDIVNFGVARVPRFLSSQDEIRQIFPSEQDIQDVVDDMEQATIASDSGKVLRLDREISEMREKRTKSLALLSEEIRQKLQELDLALAASHSTSEKKKLQKKRSDLLRPFIANFLLADDVRKTGFRQNLTIQKNLLLTASSLFRPIPETIRSFVDSPVALMFSAKNDAFFPAEEAKKRRDLQASKKRMRGENPAYFPHAPLFIEAEVDYLSHIGSVTDVVKNMKIMVDLIRRMRESKQEPTQSPVVEQRHY